MQRGAADDHAVEVVCDGVAYAMLLPQRDTYYIQGKIAKERRPYEHEMLEDMRGRLQRGDLVIDVGANIGNQQDRPVLRAFMVDRLQCLVG